MILMYVYIIIYGGSVCVQFPLYVSLLVHVYFYDIFNI